MKKLAKKTVARKSKSNPSSAGEISAYIREQSPERAKICRALMKEIKASLPKAKSKLYHGLPVWFIGENAVVGFRVTSKKGVNLLFWNGQAFSEPALEAVGKFEAAQIQFESASDIALIDLRRWLKKAGKDIWDFASLRKQC